MSVPCPASDELTRLLDGELTENRAAQLRDHVADCPACAAELAAQELLLARLATPVPGLPSAHAMAALVARLDAADLAEAAGAAAAPTARRRPGPRAWAGLAAAAAVLAVVWVAPWHREETFAPRGDGVAWTQKVGVDLWALRGAPRRLAPNDALAPGVPLVASYSNLDPAPAWLLAFALDERGEVHWLYPGYHDARTDPQALRLEGSVAQRALPESVVLEEVPPGSLRLVTVVSRSPLRVSDVEAAAPSDRRPEALRRRWPGARVDELVVRYDSLPPPAPQARP
jgi:hypothetical protein